MQEDDDPLDRTSITSIDTLKIDIEEVKTESKVPPCLVMLKGPSETVGRQWSLDRADLFLGRAQNSNIQVDDPSVSKIHAKFEVQTSEVAVTDLGSTNGTMINGVAIEPDQPHLLNNNDEIRVGGVVFKYLQRGIVSETKERTRMQSELETARSIQEAQLPEKTSATYQWVKITGCYRSATECGGDWWWHMASADKAFAIIADATGHGAAAAMITSVARAAISTLEDDLTIRVEKVYKTISQAVRKCSGGKLSMSGFFVEVDFKTRKVRYINASHSPSVLLPANTEALSWSTLPLISEPLSSVLGTEQLEYAVGEFVAQPGARMVLLTDGLVERKDYYGQMLRERIFFTFLLDAQRKHPRDQSQFLAALLASSDRNAQLALQDDDVTVVVLDF